MNYLGHFLLADLSPPNVREGYIVGGLLGDFVKGPLGPNTLKNARINAGYKKSVIDGIALHRHIDAHFDQLHGIVSVRKICRSDLRRYAGIMIDLAYDNLLACQWHSLFSEDLESFERNIDSTLLSNRHICPPRAVRLVQAFDEYQLLSRYREPIVIEETLARIAERLGATQLVEGTDDLWAIQEKINPIFKDTLSEMQNIARDFIASRT